MPLVRSQRDEFHHIESDLDVTSIERWRVSTSHSRRSSDLRSSLKLASRNPRSSSKTASWTTAVRPVVRLERVQEDEEDDGHSTYQPGPPQIPMESSVSDFLYIDGLGLIAYTPGSNRCGEHRHISRPPEATGLLSSPGAFRDPQQPHTRSNEPVPPHLRGFRGKQYLFLSLSFLTHLPLQNILYRCRRDPRNIVLDSVQPEIVPHIVITPPEFDWTDFSTMQENPPPLQQHPEYYLCVPGSGPPSLLAAVPTDRVDQDIPGKIPIVDSEEQENGPLPNDVAFVYDARPVRVFSPSLFMGMVCRVFLPLLIP